MFKRPTLGFSTFKYFLAYKEPTRPNCSKNSGVHSALAPQSKMTVLPPALLGITGPIAARRIPFTRLTMRVAPERRAPVLPAETKASPWPSDSIRRPMTMEEFFFFRMTLAGSSCISTTSSALAISMPSGRSAMLFSFRTFRISSPLPTRVICAPKSFAACKAPSTGA